MNTVPGMRSSIRKLPWALCLAGLLVGCTERSSLPAQPLPTKPSVDARSKSPTVEKSVPASIQRACGSCHQTPQPHRFTDRTWRAAIPYKYWLFERFYPEYKPLLSQAEALDFYTKHAATQVRRPILYPTAAQGTPQFRLGPLGTPRGPTLIASLEALPNSPRELVVVNMLLGEIERLELTESTPRRRRVTGATHPTRAIPTDFNDDGREDYLILELSTFGAKDIKRGRALAVLNRGTDWETRPLLSGVGRVADAAIGDVDSDGRPDLVIADFGWQKTGGLHLLSGRTLEAGEPRYVRRTLDAQAGYVALALSDMDGDGDLDLVTGMAQHHERIELWTNDGRGQFSRRVLFKGESPMWGLIGLRVVDVDGDGDQDILHFNGDTLDAPKVASFQGVHLLQNLGGSRFEARQLVELPGTHSVDTGDFNGDGLLDIVAVANLPQTIHETLWATDVTPGNDVEFESVVLLRQLKNARFEVSSLARNESCFSAVRAIDRDGDGDLDIVLGPFGVGWSLLGHSQENASAAGTERLCDRDQLYWLENRGGAGATVLAPSASKQTPEAPQRRVQALKVITQNDPSDVGYQISLSDALLTAGRFTEANQTMKVAVANNPTEAKALFQSSCQRGKLDACTNLGVLFYDGTHLERDLAKAAALYERACTGGEGNACANLALMYGAGEGVARDEKKAMTLLDTACSAKHLGACAKLGELYSSGPPGTQKIPEARSLLQRACAGGVSHACERLGTLGKATSIAAPQVESPQGLEQACAAGRTASCSRLADLYARGQGVAQDMSRAVQYALKACQGGDAESCGNAGGAFLAGTGVSRDIRRARTLFEKACRGGIERACAFLKQLPGPGSAP